MSRFSLSVSSTSPGATFRSLPSPETREALLSYETLDTAGGLTLVRVRLHTGRTHQIRVQFSHRGLPLLGDIRYGSKAPCSPALWSFRLALTHPVTGQPVDVTCPPPNVYPWDIFPALAQ